MIHTIIVDDEFLVRMGLRGMSAWEKNGFEIVGEASDGEKAFELCKSQKVDLVITDIEMPKVDGVELIQRLHQELPWIYIIVLSNHRNSDYVRETLRFNRALDYIFKLSLDETELDKTLQNVRKVIDASNNIQDHGIHEIVNEKQKTWELLLDGGTPQGNYTEIFNIDFNLSFYCICINVFTQDKSHHVPLPQIFPMIESMVHSSFNRNGKGIDVLISKNCFVVFIEALTSDELSIKENCEKAANMNTLFQNYLLGFGISNVHYGISDISIAFQQALNALGRSFFHSTPEINFYSRSKSLQSPTILFRHELTLMLYENNEIGIKEAFETYLEQCIQITDCDVEATKETCFDFLTTFASLVKQKFGISLPNIRYDTVMSTIMDCTTANDLSQEVMSYIDDLLSIYRSVRNNAVSKDIQKALDYIAKNYDKNLRLKDIANCIGMSESYLSYLFKKELGENLITYLNKYRIEKAKEMIVNSNANLSLIAEQVGYANYPYFSKVFKSVVGIEASKFKSSYILKK